MDLVGTYQEILKTLENFRNGLSKKPNKSELDRMIGVMNDLNEIRLKGGNDITEEVEDLHRKCEILLSEIETR